MNEFRAAVEAGDFAALADLLAEDVVFHSPVAFKPYEGKPIVAAILRGVGRVFTEFRYVRELTVMVRPLSGANALAQAMGAQFDQIQAEALAEMTGETR